MARYSELTAPVNYGVFSVSFNHDGMKADIEATLSCGRDFFLSVHTVGMFDRDMHYFDMVTATAWPDMDAYERSQLQILMRRVHMWGLHALADELASQGAVCSWCDEPAVRAREPIVGKLKLYACVNHTPHDWKN